MMAILYTLFAFLTALAFVDTGEPVLLLAIGWSLLCTWAHLQPSRD